MNFCKIVIWVVVIFNITEQAFCQNNDEADSLKKIVQASGTDSIKALNLFKLSWLYKKKDTTQAKNYAFECLNISKKINWQKGIAYSYHALGSILMAENNFTLSLIYFQKALTIREKNNDLRGIIGSYNAIGLIKRDLSEISSSLDYFTKSIAYSEKWLLQNKNKTNTEQYLEALNDYASALSNICTVYKDISEFSKAISFGLKSQRIYEDALRNAEKKGDKKKILSSKLNLAKSLGNIGNVFQIIPDHEKSLEYFYKSYFIFKELNNENYMALVLQNMGISYSYFNLDSALICDEMALEILKTKGDKVSIANAYASLGLIYKKQSEYEKAIEFEKKALLIFEETNFIRGITGCYGSIASNLIQMKEYRKAKIYAEKSLEFSLKYNITDFIRESYSNLYIINKGLNDNKTGLFYYEKYINIRDSFSNTEKQKDALKQTMNFEFEKQNLADSIKVSDEKKISSAKLKQEQTIKYSLYIGIIIVSLFGFFMFNRFKVTNSQKKIITLQKHEVEAQKLIVEQQKQLVEEHQKETLDSIHYAKRIQNALLANKELVDSHLKNNFVLFKPKDIVSGDFYWATEHNNRFYLAICDSTGHGVPGAFMSLLNMGFLSEAIKEKDIEKPNEIFNFVRSRLESTISNEGQKDGMDGILICLDKTTKELTYAAANNEPILISNNQIIELPKDKMPVGKGEKKEAFTLQSTSLNSGDLLYLYTDGFADQFGGPKGKKFKYKQLNELLLEISDKALIQQSDILNSSFESWRGDLEQVDDVCIIGIKI